MGLDATAPPPEIAGEEAAAEVSLATGASISNAPALSELIVRSGTADTPMGAAMPHQIERELVRRTLLPEHDDLAARHRALVHQKFEVGLSADEARELRIVRWKLDRIDDALEGEHLDVLEQLVEQQVQLARSVQAVQSALETRAPRVLQPRRRR